jgi:hypothetical protein
MRPRVASKYNWRKLARDRTDGAILHRPVIDAHDHRRHAHRRSGEETVRRTRTVRCGRWAAPQLEAKLALCEFHDGVARDAFQHVLRDGGVISFPLRTMKMLQVAPSATWPLSLRKIASSNPHAAHSSLASALFT